ncbi:MAG TPA: BrnT family toxin [Longimicrobiaceae bacterium]|nr:BrnT family toxin [Longimicrobiaceae bacterium]
MGRGERREELEQARGVHRRVRGSLFNQPLVVAEDVAHSQQEDRFYALGHADGGRMLFVVFTLRGALIRVISARDMSRKERKVYGSL